MKTFYTLLLVTFISLNALNGQLSFKSIAPDFTATDIGGEEHNLYELLDDGKVVILDVFATWCGPCWSYHNSHILADLYNEKGPNGSDEIYVFAIEGDSRTNIDCLYGQTGCNYSSIGDWTTDVPYPIIDSDDIANDYKIGYYPTIYMVYPNKQVIEIGQRDRNRIIEFANESPQPEAGLNPIVLYSSNKNGGVCPKNFPSRPNFLISNMGTETVTSMDFELKQNGDLIYESTWSGSAEPFHIITNLNLPATIVSDNVVYELFMKNINGDATQTISYFSHLTLKSTNEITVNVMTDGDAAADNNRYEIEDPNGNIVASEDISEDNMSYTFKHYLSETDCYKFILYDGGENGINGNILVTDSEGNVIFTTKNFGNKVIQEFRVSSIISNSDDLVFESIIVSPNPVFEDLIINSENKDIDMQIIDMTGKILKSYDVLPDAVDMFAMESGMYLIRFTKNESTQTQKVMKF